MTHAVVYGECEGVRSGLAEVRFDCYFDSNRGCAAFNGYNAVFVGCDFGTGIGCVGHNFGNGSDTFGIGQFDGEVIVVGIRYRDGHVCGFALLGIESCCGCFDYRRAVEVEVDREVEQ